VEGEEVDGGTVFGKYYIGKNKESEGRVGKAMNGRRPSGGEGPFGTVGPTKS
jgi:hypothetical protein